MRLKRGTWSSLHATAVDVCTRLYLGGRLPWQEGIEGHLVAMVRVNTDIDCRPVRANKTKHILTTDRF